MDKTNLIPTAAAVAGFISLIGLIVFTGESIDRFDPNKYADACAWIIGTMGGSGLAHHLGQRIAQKSPATPNQPTNQGNQP